MLNTNPPGADCGLYRQGLRIGTVQNAPGVALIEKTKHDLWVACVKPGYQMASYYNKSGAAGATFGPRAASPSGPLSRSRLARAAAQPSGLPV